MAVMVGSQCDTGRPGSMEINDDFRRQLRYYVDIRGEGIQNPAWTSRSDVEKGLPEGKSTIHMLYCSKNGISIYAGQNEGCLVKAERKDNQVVIYLN